MGEQDFTDVAVWGCGSIGLSLAASFAARRLAVLGCDIDGGRLARIADGSACRTEPDLARSVRAGLESGLLRFTHELGTADAIRAHIIAVPTPWRDGDGFDDRPLQAAIEGILAVAGPRDAICIRSTVPIGVTAALARRLKAAGRDMDVACTPDRSIEGASYREQFSTPHLIGADDPAAAGRIGRLFSRLGEILICGSAAEAEAAKLVCNATRDAMFGLANEVGRLLDGLGLDGRAVCAAAGRGYARFALPPPGPVGGPCLMKDTHLLLDAAPADAAPVIRAARARNHAIPAEVAGAIAAHVADLTEARVALLGIAFKGRPAVADLRGSPALEIAALLRRDSRHRIVVWDAEVEAAAAQRQGLSAEISPLAAARGAAAIVLANDHPALRALDFDALLAAAHPRALIYDLWGHTLGQAVTLQPGQMLRVLGGGIRRGAQEAPAP
ncbi:MAG: nucleotide sugar dehydrogenase [Alphaproteobacteria bacterium]|nr:nucleotide sugar dehydrogenase [Alphaproteobacteria bacterium]